MSRVLSEQTYAHIRKITLREGPSAPVAGQIPGWALCVVVGRIAEKGEKR